MSSKDSLKSSFHYDSQEKIKRFRHREAAFMLTHLAYELLPESGKVIALDFELPVEQAFMFC